MTTLTDNPVTNIVLLKRLADEAYHTNRILADMTIVQGILEGGLRNSPPSQLALKYNNLFGIKGTGTKGFINLPTMEFIKGNWVRVVPKNQIINSNSFAWNASVEDSIAQHKKLLSKPRYAKVALAKTFEEAATEIWLAGYATDPKYPALLMGVYKQYVNRPKLT